MNIKFCMETADRLRRQKGCLINYSIDEVFPLLSVNGAEVPLMPWRFEQRFSGMKSCLTDGTLSNISAVKAMRINSKGICLRKMLCRELDLCEWLSDSTTASVFAVENGGITMNIIAAMQSGAICTIELAATLSPDSTPIDRYEVICAEGMVMDRTVDTQLQSASLYLFTDDKNNPQVFNDLHREMLGLDPEEVALVKNVLDMFGKPQNVEKQMKNAKRLLNLADTSLQSASCGQQITVEGKII